MIQLNSQNLDTAQQRIQIDSLLNLSRQHLSRKSNDTSIMLIDQASVILEKEAILCYKLKLIIHMAYIIN